MKTKGAPTKLKAICSKENCSRPVHGRGLCNSHLVRANRTDDRNKVDWWPLVVDALGIEGANKRRVTF